MKKTKGNYIYVPLIIMLAIHIQVSVAIGQPLKTTGWQQLDLKRDQILGISADAAYTELLQGRSGVPIVVAVIDGGVDTTHLDLSSVLWRNSGEIAGNGKDDDHNGYVDDVHGWNFMGDKKGSFQQDNYDVIRRLRQSYQKKQETCKLQGSVNNKRWSVQRNLEETQLTLKALEAILVDIGKKNPTLADFKNYRYSDYAQEQQLIKIVAALSRQPDVPAYRKHLQSRLENYTNELNYALNIDYDPRKGKAFTAPFNGNGDVEGSWTVHGSHVAGIIVGRTVGVARANVQLMVLRTVPAGDYLDWDMARAIRYAADNGARVINISAGKSGSTDPALLESAIRHAMEKDVLIVHASGNQGQLLERGYYPRGTYKDGKVKAWLEVGASGPANDSSLVLSASNYGKEVVDVLAPGVKIRSCSPNNGYSEQSGTSMAAAVVSGMAAVLRSYYPGYSAERIREIILDSVQQVDHLVLAPSGVMVSLTEICASGGVVNLYRALQQAENLKHQSR